MIRAVRGECKLPPSVPWPPPIYLRHSAMLTTLLDLAHLLNSPPRPSLSLYSD